MEAELGDCQLQVCVNTWACVCVCVWESSVRKRQLMRILSLPFFHYVSFLSVSFFTLSFVALHCSWRFTCKTRVTFAFPPRHAVVVVRLATALQVYILPYPTHTRTQTHTPLNPRTTNVAFWLSPTVAFGPLLTLTRLGISGQLCMSVWVCVVCVLLLGMCVTC